MSNTTKAAIAAVALAFAGVGAYWHYSPYLTIKQMRTAAEQNDADTFNAHVDYPKVRESLKGQLAAMMAEKLGSSGGATGGFEGLGAALGLALINPMIDAMVRPEMVMRSMQEGKLKPLPGGAGDSAGAAERAKEPKWEFDRVEANKLVAYAVDPDGKVGTQVGAVFERSGFADWKLTELRLPADVE
jgi:Protein of unknown function (DUF2939)